MLLSGVNSMLHSSLSLLLGVLSSVLCAIWRVVNCLMQDLLLLLQVQVQVQMQMTVMKCLHYSQDSDGMLQWHKPNTNEVDPRAKRPANNSGTAMTM
jgi:hypothetical protein